MPPTATPSSSTRTTPSSSTTSSRAATTPTSTTPPRASIAPDQAQPGCYGDSLRYDLTVANEGKQADTIDIAATPGANGWTVLLNDSSGTSALTDTDGDAVPDVGALPPFSSVGVTAFILIPPFPPP